MSLVLHLMLTRAIVVPRSSYVASKYVLQFLLLSILSSRHANGTAITEKDGIIRLLGTDPQHILVEPQVRCGVCNV